MKSYTNIEQSKVLSEILPHESADMAYYFMRDSGTLVNPSPFVLDGTEVREDGMFIYLNCWSLAALLNILPQTVRLVGTSKDSYWYCECVNANNQWYAGFESASNPVDATYEMIIKLNELNLL